ncbi:Gfo/Idh/MocA family protein [Nibricoccus sp. IMCC34717]|uniref:Gfo/Idh/MocA family protein n=1 Tax=Nibricoccus sp. IMCC34717 TaxID=3034021 RepID=UPI00384D34A9
MTQTLRWGILSTGNIASKFAKDLPQSHTGRPHAVASRALAPAEAFAQAHGIPRAHGSYEALLADAEVDAVYVATPHPQHLEWTIRALEAGKHVLCEKPLALNRAQGERMVAAARSARRTLMEAFMYRCHPQTARLVDLVRSGALGQVELLQAAFSFCIPYDRNSRLFNPELGGGGILDVGLYPVSMARLIAGAVSGKPYLDPEGVHATGRLSPDGVDVHATALLTFANGFSAQVSCGIGLQQDNSLRIYGTKGWVQVPLPWFPSISGPRYTLVRHNADWNPGTEEHGEVDRPLYAIEADAFGRAALAGQLEVPEMSWGDTLGNLGTLDRWRAALGVRYSHE